MTSGEAFPFAIDRSLRPWSRVFLIHPETCVALLDEGTLTVLFGRWTVTTPVSNIAGVELNGPYRWWKVGGPARMSAADRGLTFATTSRGGACLSFHEPVRALDPFGAWRHPGLTVTVADPEQFAVAVEAAIASNSPVRDGGRRLTPGQGTYRATARGLVAWARRDDSVRHVKRSVAHIEPPCRLEPNDAIQRFEDGVGPAYHRRYEIRVATDHDADSAMALLHADLNRLANQQLGPITKLGGRFGIMEVGDRYVVALAGPWSGPVEVLEVTSRRFRLATMPGHLEAGLIDFTTDDDDGHLVFAIESYATNGGPLSYLLYDVIGMARALQAEMWVEACELVAGLVDGRQLGPVTVTTERAR